MKTNKYRYYILSPSSAITTCPFAMTDGAARLLAQHLPNPPSSVQSFFSSDPVDGRREAEIQRKVFTNAHFRLISRDQSTRWTSGQWMTERPGGSDISRSETVAVYSPLKYSSQLDDADELGPWLVDGYKFFSSATDADMSILLAKTASGLSAFFAPMRLPNGERNGVRIVRLKKKLGTRALPTAELELKGMRAWLIGVEGEGIKEISTVLNITRIHNAVIAVSFMRRGLAIAKVNPYYSKFLRKIEILTTPGICESPYCRERQAAMDDAFTSTNAGASRVTPQSVDAPHVFRHPSSFSYRIPSLTHSQSPFYHASRIPIYSFFHHRDPAFPHPDANDKGSNRKVGHGNAI